MNKEKLFAFTDELNKLYEKYGLYVDTDAVSDACFIEPDDGETVVVAFDKEEKRYTLWTSKVTSEEGRVWFELK